MHQLMVICTGLEILRHLWGTHTFQNVQDEYAVMGRERTSTLSDDVGVRNVVFVRCFCQSVDAVIHILLNAVVDAAFAVAASCSVVVHTQSASAVDEFDIESHGSHLYIVLRYLAQGGADTAYLVDL